MARSSTVIDYPHQLASPTLRQVFGYWRAKALKRGALPARADIDPLDFGGVLPAVSLVEVRRDATGRPGRLRYRVMGGLHVEIMGRDATGELIDLGSSDHDAAAAAIATERAVYASRQFSPANGVALSFEALVCPLAADGHRVDMLLCAVAPNYKVDDLPVARVNRFARAALETISRR